MASGDGIPKNEMKCQHVKISLGLRKKNPINSLSEIMSNNYTTSLRTNLSSMLKNDLFCKGYL